MPSRPSRPPRAQRLATLVASVCFSTSLVLSAHAAPMTDQVVQQNRSCMFLMGGDVPPAADPDFGIFQLDDPNDRVSLRFTAPTDRTAASVWIHLGDSNLTRADRMRLRLSGNSAGLPLPEQGPSDWNSFVPTRGWQEVALANPVAMVTGTIYHVVIEAQPGTVLSPSNFVEFTTPITRFPIDFQAEDPTTPGPSSFRDDALAFLYQDHPARLLKPGLPSGVQFQPLFSILCTDGIRFGSPYDRHLEPIALGDTLFGQVLRFSQPTAINYIGGFMRSVGGGDDKLQVELHDASLPPGSNPIASAILVPNPPSVLNRAHWFGASFARDIQIHPGMYTLVYRDIPGSQTPKGFHVSLEGTTLPSRPGQRDPGFGGEASYAVTSTNGGLSFDRLPFGTDMPFVLMRLDDPTGSARAIFDEGSVRYPSGGVALTALPGESLRIGLTHRNIGPVAAPLVYDVIDIDTGASVQGGPIQETLLTPPNQDSSGATTAYNIPVVVPASLAPGDLWRVMMRVGHEDAASGLFVFDDEAAFEVRVR